MQKHPFTNKRIGSLLADIARYKLNQDTVGLVRGGEYRFSVDFKVDDECILIHCADIFELKEKQ